MLYYADNRIFETIHQAIIKLNLQQRTEKEVSIIVLLKPAQSFLCHTTFRWKKALISFNLLCVDSIRRHIFRLYLAARYKFKLLRNKLTKLIKIRSHGFNLILCNQIYFKYVTNLMNFSVIWFVPTLLRLYVTGSIGQNFKIANV